MDEPDAKIVAHLNTLSTRALHVIFAARLKAGQRGAKQIEVGDLLIGIVLEDNGKVGNLLSQIHEELSASSVSLLPPHIPFFPLEAADEVQTRIENLLPRSEPIEHRLEVPLSPDIEHVFDGANEVQSTFHHNQIQPLHLLAAVLTQDSSPYIKLLQDVGITKELVLERLRAAES